MSNWPCDRAAQEKPPLQGPPLVLPAAAVALRQDWPERKCLEAREPVHGKLAVSCLVLC